MYNKEACNNVIAGASQLISEGVRNFQSGLEEISFQATRGMEKEATVSRAHPTRHHSRDGTPVGPFFSPLPEKLQLSNYIEFDPAAESRSAPPGYWLAPFSCSTPSLEGVQNPFSFV